MKDCSRYPRACAVSVYFPGARFVNGGLHVALRANGNGIFRREALEIDRRIRCGSPIALTTGAHCVHMSERRAVTHFAIDAAFEKRCYGEAG